MMSAHLLGAVCRADQGCTMQCIALSGASTITGADVVRLCYAAWGWGKTIAHVHLPAKMPRCLYVYSSFMHIMHKSEVDACNVAKAFD